MGKKKMKMKSTPVDEQPRLQQGPPVYDIDPAPTADLTGGLLVAAPFLVGGALLVATAAAMR